MNKILSKFARQNLKKGLTKCTSEQTMVFKRMYSHSNLDAEIELVIENMPDEQLDWAMQQAQRQLVKNEAGEIL